MTALLVVVGASAQDTTQVYPWRFSNFPYVTVSPNDGAMVMYRGVFFRQSRWDDRVSVHSSVAVEGGYSTKDSWLLRARGDFPRLADGWRLQVIGQAEKDREYWFDGQAMEDATKQFVGMEITRHIVDELSIAVHGGAYHLTRTFPAGGGTVAIAETDFRARAAVVLDFRDREYDTRNGALLQVGAFAGSDADFTKKTYHGFYGIGSYWVPLSSRTRVTTRIAVRMGSALPIDAARTIPAWEDEFLVVGGPESNRALPVGARWDRTINLASVEIRHDLKVFPGGAIAVLAFVDGGRATCDDCTTASTGLRSPDARLLPGYSRATSSSFSGDWAVGPGVGIAVRLLRNAVLTATVARAEGATRFYVSSGWSW